MNRRQRAAYEQFASLAMLWLVISPATVLRAESTDETSTDNTPTTQPASAIESEVGTVAGPGSPFPDFTRNERLIGDWGRFLPVLETKGIGLSIALTSIYQHNAHGGVKTHHGHQVTGSVDTELTADSNEMGLYKGGKLYLYTESGWGDGIDNRVGDMFGVNGDTMGDEEIRVRELWYEQQFLDDKMRFKFGKIDLAVDIDTNEYANWEVTQFLNNALINTGNIPLPDMGLGAVFGLQPTDWFYATLAAADAQASVGETGFRTTFHGDDDFFGALEMGLTPTWQTTRGKLPGHYRFILWYDPQPKPEFVAERPGHTTFVPYKRDDLGFAFNMDQLIWKEKPDENDKQGLGVFLRYGYAPAEVNEVEHFWSLGAQYQGLLPTRDDDVLGFGFAQGIMSDRLRLAQPTAYRESVYELYYNCVLFPWLHISPDFQYITDPGGDRTGRDAFVAGLRLVIAL